MEKSAVPVNKPAGRTAGTLSIFKNPKYKCGVMAMALSLLAAAAFAASNFAFFVLSRRVNLEIDMTTQQLYSVSREAKSFLASLKTPVTITVFQDETAFDSRTAQALSNYEKLSDCLALQRVDLNLNPAFAGDFAGQTFTDTSIVVQSDRGYRVLEERELYYLKETDHGVSVAGIKIDQKLCSAIAGVTAEEQNTAAVVRGHGETVSSELAALCETANRACKNVNLMTEEPDAGADIAIICQPSADYEAAEIKKLEDFLAAGNHRLLVFLDAQAGRLPVFEAFLQEWGIALEENIVIDLDHYWGASETCLLAEYPDNPPVGAAQKEKNIAAVMPVSRSLTLRDSADGRYSASPILYSYASAYAKSVTQGLNTLEGAPGDARGPFLLAACSSSDYILRNKSHTGAVIVFGSAAMSADALLQSPALANRQILLDCVTLGSAQTDLMGIQPVYLQPVSLQMTSAQARLYRILLMGLLPLLLCAACLWVTVRRQRR